MFFPHVDFSRLRWSDTIRIPLQLLWLALVRSDADPIRDLAAMAAALRRLVADVWHLLRAAIANSIRQLAILGVPRRLQPDADRICALSEHYASHRLWNHAVLRYAAYCMALPLAALAITTPFSIFAQAIFAALLLSFALLMKWISGSRNSGSVPITLLIALSVTVSARYFWWRISSTLDWEEPLDLLWGELLIAAELYAWGVLLLGYLRSVWPRKRRPVRYGNAMLRFFEDGSQLIFLTAPLAFLLFHATIIYAPAMAVALYALPHMGHARIAHSRMQGKHPRSFWAKVEKIALGWRNERPASTVLPASGKAIAALVFLGFCFGIDRLLHGPHDEMPSTLLNLVWISYNMLLLGAAISVASKVRPEEQTYKGLSAALGLGLMGYVRLAAPWFGKFKGICDWSASLLPRMPAAADKSGTP